MAQRSKVVVRIAGKDYTLVGVESDEYIQRIGLFVDKKMNEIRTMYSKLSTSMIAVLTATNVTDDYFKSCDKVKKLESSIKELQSTLQIKEDENSQLKEENEKIRSQNTHYQLELAKTEAELREVRKNYK